MSVALTVGLERRLAPRRGPCPEARSRSRAGAGGETTLERVISGAWEGLATRSAVICPVCAGVMFPRPDTARTVVVGRCGGCGSELG